MDSIHRILKTYWGFDSFRPMQEEIIRYVLEGRDVLALLPTGGGKSICFQVPAMAMEGLCLVVSPLVALMKDQVENLRNKGIDAFAIHAAMSRKEVEATFRAASGNNGKFLYVSPERLETSLFREYLPSLGVCLLAVDEAHCISQWGYDFRPPYLRIAALREEIPGIPVLALTASATPDVQKDICERLSFPEHRIIRQSFARPNLSYSVFNTDSKIPKILHILNQVGGSGIVYCRSRKKTREIADLLTMHGISADYYHAGLSNPERNRKQEDWIRNRIRTMVCTNAFGMGIDKPDVRVVIHADCPESLENYYQEAGRAGRDGKKAYAVLLYENRDKTTLEELIDTRYPSPEEVREVYRALMNYLQVPAGTGEEGYFNFDFSEFLNRFKLGSQLVAASLKTLEQENLLSYQEQILVPSRLRFTCGKEQLFEFEKNHPELDPLVKSLLRSYEGIFDFPVPVYETAIGKILGISPEELNRQLVELHNRRIVSYLPKKENPQIYFFRNRAEADFLPLDPVAMEKRKEIFGKRLQKMIQYLGLEKSCRSVFLASYFGEEKPEPCGICDNCLKEKRKPLTPEEFDSISEKILHTLHVRPLPVQSLLTGLKGVQQEKAWEVIQFLQSENRIRVNGDGMLSRTGN